MPLASGASFAEFTIVRLLGSGASGTAYLVDHPQAAQPVVLKILRSEVSTDAHFRGRFRRDMVRAAKFDHPNIARVVDHGQARGRLWVATEYIDGPDAGTLLHERYPDGMPSKSVLLIVNHIADALDFANRRGVVHRHVTPTNILFDDPYSDAYRILVTDFGAARGLAGLDAVTSRTLQRLLDYAAPEQLTGDEVDVRTDQYGLAATAFHLLTAAAPSDPQSGLADLKPVFTKAMATDPADRFQTCRDFATALAGPSAVDVPQPAPAKAAATPDRPIEQKAVDPAAVDADSPPSRRRSVLAPVVLALVMVAVLTAAGLYFVRVRTSPSAPSSTPTAPPAAARQAPPPCGPQVVAASLSTRDKLAQLLMVGVTGAADARAVVADQHVGGIMIGSWTDLSMLRDGSLRNIADSSGPLPLAVSVDEEGGRVQRLASLIGRQVSPRVLAQSSSPQEVFAIALDRGRQMKELGITIDFAPVVDLTDAPDNTVIGDRSFGSDPQTVIDFAKAYAGGLREAGLLPVLKHFPGHGSASGDSHQSGVTTPPLAVLQNNDLIPYRTLTTETPVALMLGHMQVPGLTDANPASLSKAAYDLLRSGAYGGPPFNGLVFTDDLSSMGAINQRYSVEEAVLLALQAGADVALWITTDEVPGVLNRLEQAVNTGELSLDRVDEAAARVAMTKAQVGAVAGASCPASGRP
ncbi:serine/threonine protein kinase [Mycolicibacterium rhodesiae JS60]|nr:serine/threonine protein kinase [Mycolicibacterium rhodesiae JS60]